MLITQATIADVPELSELLAILFAQEPEFRPNRDAQIRGLTRIISDAELGVVFVSKEAGKPVGMVNLLFTVSTALGETVALLEDMIVAPSHRGGQVGAQLLSCAVDHARMNGCKRITLLTDADNLAAQRFYTRQGFVQSAMVPMRLRLD